MKKISVVIHAHLYQPPREDPWIEEIEGEESAAPYSNWNERITAECYRPMGAARVLDDRGRVVEIVNNYRHVSFNVGPTLAAWLERRAPEVLAAMREGDEDSRRRLRHGNAIAQVYNHVIMPLADRRDKETQVLWGIADFRRRFGRRPEAMWLAETAIDAETAEVLAAHGMKFVILAPGQAEAIRPPNGEWRDVAGGKIDPRWPYRLRTSAGDLAAFFYDGALAHDISFAHLLRSGDELARRLKAAAGDPPPADDPLVHVATDGEVYGHHEPFGDMCLAHVVTRAGPAAGLRFTNYAAHLARKHPTWEVRLTPGPNGEGTAWSCAHGVGRWARDCGCRTGGPGDSSQAWRAPLRAAYDALRDRLRVVFEREGRKVLRDPWAARDAYIDVVLDPTEASRQRFLQEHLARRGAEETAWRLLESQRHAMLMYTSCAWFFWDVSGIETVQTMKYAHRAIRVLGGLAPPEAERGLLRGLAEAKSNIPAQRDGAWCYRRWVLPLEAAPARAAVQHEAVRLRRGVEGPVHTYAVAVERRRDGTGRTAAVVRTRHARTGERDRFAVLLRRTADPFEIEGIVVPLAEQAGPDIDRLAAASWDEAARSLGRIPEARPVGLGTIFRPERRALVEEALRAVRAAFRRDLDALLDDLAPILRAAPSVGVPVPRAIADVAARALSERVLGAVDEALERVGTGPRPDGPVWSRAAEAVALAERLGLRLDLGEAAARIGAALADLFRRVEDEGAAPDVLRAAHDLLVEAQRAGLRPDLTRAQESLLRLVRGPLREILESESDRDLAEAIRETAAFANLAPLEGLAEPSQGRLDARCGRG